MATQNNSIAGSGYGNEYLDALIAGSAWSGASVSYSFRSGSGNLAPLYPASSSTFSGYAWLQSQKDAFVSAINLYSHICNLTFTNDLDNSINSNLGLWVVDNYTMSRLSDNIAGIFFAPDGTFNQVVGGFNWQASTFSNLTPGGYGFETMVHEIGHALGLAHPHDGGTESDKTIFPGVTSYSSVGTNDLNQEIWTAMSYNQGWKGQPTTTSGYGEVMTPMAFDIAALQKLYGVNNTYNTGNNTYSLSTSNAIGTGWSCIWDAGGSDTISALNYSGACTIDLRQAPLTGANAGGYVSWISGIVGGFTIANNVIIENAIGGNGNDSIVGNEANNNLNGGSGNDSISGGLGNDTIDGGLGPNDYVIYANSRNSYSISATNNIYTISGPDGIDTVSGVEFFTFLNATYALTSLDVLPPSISITSNTNNLNYQSTQITFSLSEVSVNFSISDVTVTGGTLTNFLGSGATYTATFAPTISNGNASISVAEAKFTDSQGNNNIASNTVTLSIDTIAPTVLVSSNDTLLTIGETATLTFTLSENSTNFTLDDISSTGGSLSNFSGSGTSYTASYTPTQNSNINGSINVANGKFTDAFNNNNIASNTVTLSIDTIAPTVTIASNKNSINGNQSANITFALTESSSNFDINDISVSGGILSNFAGSGALYSALFAPVIYNGDASIRILNNEFNDLAGNSNLQSNNVSMSIHTKLPEVVFTEQWTKSINAPIFVSTNNNKIWTFDTENFSSMPQFNLVEWDSQGNIKQSFRPSAISGNYFFDVNQEGDPVISFNQEGSIFLSIFSLQHPYWQYGLTPPPSAIATDHDNSIYLALAPTRSNNHIIKVNNMGSVIWDYERNDIPLINITDLSVSFNDSFVAIGTWILSDYGAISKFSSDGTLLWTSKLAENWSAFGFSVTQDSLDNIYVGGFCEGHPDYPAYGDRDAFIQKFSTSGTLLWTRVFGTSAYDEITSIEVTSDDSILVVGNSNGNIDHIKTGENNTDIFVANYDSSGNQRWIYQYGTATEDHAQSLAAGQNGTFYISGYTSGSLDGEANSNNELNNFLAAFKFNASPTFVSSNLLIDNQYFNTKDNITLSFDEAITKNLDSDAGVILLKQGSKIIETFNRTKFTINDNAITINPKNDLSYHTAYTLEIGAGLIKNITDSPLENESYAINFETTDTFSTSLNTYTLNSSAAFARNILYTGTSHFSGTGNSYNNLITSGIGNDNLDGQLGIDTLVGGLGNDTYIVDSSFDIIIENINEGNDMVKSSVNYELSSNLENLTLMGSKSINGTGNSLNNIITGNNGNNKLDGGLGVNTLIGGKGNDTYIVYINDVVIENRNEGTDTVQSSSNFTLSSNIENLTLTGSSNINGIGNTLNNVITGNIGNNTLSGGDGNDLFISSLGADKYIGGAGFDRVSYKNLEFAININLSLSLNPIDFGKLILCPFNGHSYLALLGSVGNDYESLYQQAHLLGGHLLTITSQEEQDWLTQTYTSEEGGLLRAGPDFDANGILYADYYFENSFLGLIKNDAGLWLWSDGPETDSLATFFNWHTYPDGSPYPMAAADYAYARFRPWTGDNDWIFVDSNGIYDNQDLNQTRTEYLNRYQDTIIEFEPNEVLRDYFEGIENITGSNFNDTIYGSEGNNLLEGESGDDYLDGLAGDDSLLGGNGNDALTGGDGNDNISGGNGNDYFLSGIDSGNDKFDGNAGIDRVQYLLANSGVKVDLNLTLNNVFSIFANGSRDFSDSSHIGIDTVINIEDVLGSNFADVLLGNRVANHLIGAGGSDLLDGGLGNDILTGELSNDVMFVTPGGHNTFRFSSALNAKTNKDTITDFTPGTDKIYLDDAIFRKFTGDNSQLRYVSSDNFLVLGNHLQDANDYLIYNDQTGSLYYDADGSGKGAMIEFANLSNYVDLTYADISIV